MFSTYPIIFFSPVRWVTKTNPLSNFKSHCGPPVKKFPQPWSTLFLPLSLFSMFFLAVLTISGKQWRFYIPNAHPMSNVANTFLHCETRGSVELKLDASLVKIKGVSLLSLGGVVWWGSRGSEHLGLRQL